MHPLHKEIQQASTRIAPLWPLANFVAVNPYQGFSNRPFADMALYLKQVQDADLLMPGSWYAHKFAEGEIGMDDLRAAIGRASGAVLKAYNEAGIPFDERSLVEGIESIDGETEVLFNPGTFSAYLDARLGTHWQEVIREEAAKWCAAYHDRGQSSWGLPWKEMGLFAGWKQAVLHDRNLACAGLSKARKVLTKLPDDPHTLIEESLRVLNIPADHTTEFLYRELLILPGWAGHLRYLDREEELKGESGSELVQLLAILLGYERVLHHHFTADEECLLGWQRTLMEEPAEEDHVLPLSLAQRLVWQDALEHSIENRLRYSIRPTTSPHSKTANPEIQAVFCIDVRSEGFRRNLESASDDIRTIGFAGFFGVPLKHTPFGQKTSQSRCPALLEPPLKSHECSGDHHACANDPHATERSLKRFREAAASCFSYVETTGLAYAWELFRSAFGIHHGHKDSAKTPGFLDDLDLGTKVTLAAGIAKGLTLTKYCGKLVLLCGHGSSTVNNPYASGLDCGACGGHPGDANARIAAALLNDPAVRDGLKSQGIALPEDAFFVAGIHNTTTDEVSLYDEGSVPDIHRQRLIKLKESLIVAGALTVSLRARSLDGQDFHPPSIPEVRSRSRDWSQVRPEWGLAGNAGFIVAPRSWTQSADLGGRAFLHEYDPAGDPEGTLLESILAGPLVVGSWINLQYYASSADNRHYGSGHKAIHNVVGGLGVALGNEGDLKHGLSFQSVHNGRELVHEPTRLHACVAADPEVIGQILERQVHLAELVENDWLHLFVMGADGRQWTRIKRSAKADNRHTQVV